jgi:hypothetical protein
MVEHAQIYVEADMLKIIIYNCLLPIYLDMFISIIADV